jgi:ferritin-like metal-binding protein YciE
MLGSAIGRRFLRSRRQGHPLRFRGSANPKESEIPSMTMRTLEDLLNEEVSDLISVESQIQEALPLMISSAHSPELRDALEAHLAETRDHSSRLSQAKLHLNMRGSGKHCKGMAGILAEGAELVAQEGDADVKDAALISAAQRVEHYEIAAYGSACTYADMLGKDEVKDLLGENLKQEKAADEKLTKLATGGLLGTGINKEAQKN